MLKFLICFGLLYSTTLHSQDLEGSSSIVKSPDPPLKGTFTDLRDHQEYRWIRIGNQTWMAENLNYRTEKGSWCYENQDSHCDTYGRLYDWNTARHVCPEGWHLPGDDEWKELEVYLGMSQASADDSGWRGSDEGGKLKETGTNHWNSPNTGAANTNGFAALPGGYRSYNGSFYVEGYSARFWTATEYGSFYTFVRRMDYDQMGVYKIGCGRDDGFSIRCLRD